MSSGTAYGCTLGLNAYFSGGSPAGEYFVTNSHCTPNEGGNDHSVEYQPASNLATDIVADEYSDPLFLLNYNSDARCAAGRRCRYSDAALFKYRSGISVDQGYIARTQCRNCASVTPRITIDANKPRFVVTQAANYPYQGQWLNKMGATTGWTYGPVLNSCANEIVLDDNGNDTGSLSFANIV